MRSGFILNCVRCEEFQDPRSGITFSVCKKETETILEEVIHDLLPSYLPILGKFSSTIGKMD